MWVRNCWYVAGWDHELEAGEIISRTILGEPVALYRAGDGGTVALEDRCCHRFAPLSRGRLEGDDLRCMYHGLKFDRSGACVEIPGQDLIPRTACVRTYPVVQRHSWIWVWMGDPARADEALIPAAVGLDDPDWNLRSGYMDYEANYQLINDNLTDFTHLSYVHANSFGSSDEFAHTRPNIERLDRGLRIWRWILKPSRPDASNVLRRNGDVESWQTYDFLVPGVLLMRSAVYPQGTAERCAMRPPPDDVEPVNDTFTSQAVTPITEKTSRYFFSWGPRSGQGSDAVADALLELANLAFSEDKSIIEAQQRMIDLDPGRKEVLTSADVGPTQFRSVIQRLVAAESGVARASAVA